MPDYYLINKPYGMLSQFTREAPGHRVLGDLFDFPKDVYPVGRLDRDSEGLLGVVAAAHRAVSHRLVLSTIT